MSFKANMTGVFTALLGARRALAPKAGVMIQQRANLRTKPPKDKIGPLVSLQICVSVLSFLVKHVLNLKDINVKVT